MENYKRKLHNSLKFEDKYKLIEWIKENKNFVFDNQWHEIESRASEHVQVRVTRFNIESCLYILGFNRSGPQLNNSEKKSTRSSVRTLARAFLSLCKELGHKPVNIRHLEILAEINEGNDAPR